ncbi:hypothetical protein, partial [Mesorhizobium sp.]|uniref:hypothetical protein n=1 Tax=Mesorhizobium sp. TaxID=1871066 RepID=UPI00341ADECC
MPPADAPMPTTGKGVGCFSASRELAFAFLVFAFLVDRAIACYLNPSAFEDAADEGRIRFVFHGSPAEFGGEFGAIHRSLPLGHASGKPCPLLMRSQQA